MAIHSVGFSVKQAEVVSRDEHFPSHAQSVEECLSNFETTLQGLSTEEAGLRQQGFERKPAQGEAKVQPNKPKDVFLAAFKTWISWLFLATAGLSFYTGHPSDGLLILGAMVFNGSLHGLIQWKSIRSQNLLEAPDTIRCSVRRDGQTQMLSADELVIGDILIISGGQVMPADARLLSSYQLQVDESLLTGESVLVPKNAGAILHPAEEVGSQCNMLFAGTIVKTGKGEAVVTAMGAGTVMGRVAAIANTTERRESPFTQKLNLLAFRIFLLVALLTAVVIGVGYHYGMPWPQLLQVGLMLMIAAFPKTLPGLATLILSMGINRLSEQKVLVKSFQSIESIADITVVCSDKTGTLTENYLSFDQLFLPCLGAVPYDPKWQMGEDIPCASAEALLRIGRLNNSTVMEGLRSPLMGDPIDVALFRAAPASLETGYHQRINIPFDPVKLRSATICDAPEGQMVSLIKGAPEAVMEVCRYYMKPDGSVREISLAQRSEFLMHNRKLAYENNLRVIGFAQKPIGGEDDENPYTDAVFVGWVCLLDPPKPGVVEVIGQLREAGTDIIMITGDQKATAEITAWELGIMRKKSDEVWLRADLDAWDEPKIPANVRVFARTQPEEKLAIVESLQRSGQIVAMVGDGMNDSPALQKSDVSVAMGLKGSETAKDNADIILLNDRLDGLLAAMRESGILRRKIQSCIRFILSCNLALILFVSTAVLSGQGLPIHIVQMLWLNLVIISLPTLVLAIEPTREKTGLDKSRTPKSNPLESSHLFLVFYWAILIAAAGLGTYFLCVMGLKQSPEVAGTAAFCTLALSQAFNLFNVQAINAEQARNDFLVELSGMPITWLVIGLVLCLQAATVYLPGVNNLLGTVPLLGVIALVPIAFSVAAILFSLKTMKAPTE